MFSGTDKVLDFLTAILCVLTGVYVWVTHRASQILQKQSDALMNAERAWITADIDWSPHARKTIFEGTSIEDGRTTKTTSAYVVLSCRNGGKTPAWIIEKRVKLGIFCPLPKEPEFTQGRMKGEFLEFVTEPVEVNVCVTSPEIILECEGRWEHPDKLNILALYGYVKYRDIFSQKRQERYTGFGYAVYPDRTIKRIATFDGWDSYNRYT
jgi:hypothetical protein